MNPRHQSVSSMRGEFLTSFPVIALIPLVLLPILVIWALVQGDMYAKEGLIYGGIWLVCLLGILLVRGNGAYFAVPVALADIVLVMKFIGNTTIH